MSSFLNVFDVVPESNFYPFSLVEANGVQEAKVAFRGGSNGFMIHRRDRWSTLLRCPLMQNGDIALLVEIVARAGPMLVFKIERAALPGPGSPQSVVRTIGSQTIHVACLYS